MAYLACLILRLLIAYISQEMLASRASLTTTSSAHLDLAIREIV